MSDGIELKPCPFCGADVRMVKSRPIEGCGGTPSYIFSHPDGDCVVRRSVVCVNIREASEWSFAWNRRHAR